MDTGARYALQVADDENHPRAISFQDVLRKGEHGSLATSDYVLDETLTLLRMRKGLSPALGFLDMILESKSVHLVWLDTGLFREAAGRLRESGERRWSFTDCTSFAIMTQLGIGEAFAFDENFAEAGFNRLP